LLAAGSSNQAIAEELVVALDPVKRHLTHIFDKLGVANRTQAVTGPGSCDCCPRSTGRQPPAPRGRPLNGYRPREDPTIG
jgi:hypothetical protein